MEEWRMIPELKWIVWLTDAEYRGHSFNGTSLRETVARLTAVQAADDDTHERYTAWGLVLHCAFFKWKMTRFIDPEFGGRFLFEEKAFPRLPEDRSAAGWAFTLAQSDRVHHAYLARLSGLESRRLGTYIPEWDCDFGHAAAWIATHDTYHTAQIRNMGLEGV
jgi:hypothetical protein